LKSGDVATAWGGIAGVQSTLSVLLEAVHQTRALTLARIVELLSATPARRFRIANKGALSPGCDADIVLVDLTERTTFGARDLQQRYRSSPYVGRSFQGRVRRTIRRGETIVADGRITARTGGRLVRPAAPGVPEETSDV
jgi:allantoinase